MKKFLKSKGIEIKNHIQDKIPEDGNSSYF